MKRFFLLHFILISVGLTWQPALGLDIQELHTKSGLKVLLVEDHTHPIVTFSFAFRGGASQEAEGKAGTLNLMSALLDEGAGKMNAVAYQDKLEDLATRLSFSAGRDYFRGSLQTLNYYIDDAFEMLGLALYEPRFDDKPLKRIRDQVLSVIRAEANNPGARASARLREAIYPTGHPYIRTIRGDEETVKSITADDMRALKSKIMGRDNLILSMVGAITAEEAIAHMDRLFEALPEEASLTPVLKVKPKLGDEVFVDADLPQIRYTLIGQGVDRLDPDYFAAYLVNQIVGGSGLTSRLSLEVREKRGLAYSIGSSLVTDEAVSLFSASVATRVASADETLSILQRELRRMAQEGPTEEELALAKSYTIGVYALNFDGSRDIASTLTSIQAAGLPSNYITTRREAINSVTLEKAQAAAERLFGEGKYTLLRVGPRPKDG